MVTDRDIRLWTSSPTIHHTMEQQMAEWHQLKVGECMHNEAMVTVEEDTPILEAVKLIRVSGVGGLPVTEGDSMKIVGICTRTDLIDHLIRVLEPIPLAK
jgi:CBS domain-containing protein